MQVKLLGHETDNSLPSNVDIKNEWSYIYTPPYAFMVHTKTTLLLSYPISLFSPTFHKSKVTRPFQNCNLQYSVHLTCAFACNLS